MTAVDDYQITTVGIHNLDFDDNRCYLQSTARIPGVNGSKVRLLTLVDKELLNDYKTYEPTQKAIDAIIRDELRLFLEEERILDD